MICSAEGASVVRAERELLARTALLPTIYSFVQGTGYMYEVNMKSIV